LVKLFAYGFRGGALVKDTRCSIGSELRHFWSGGVFVEYIGNIVMSFEAYLICKGA
jgi:hypothetical protein